MTTRFKRILVSWVRCPFCGLTDGVHTLGCDGESACMRCGKRIEDTADMKEDGFCVKCGNEFIAECEKYHGESR